MRNQQLRLSWRNPILMILGSGISNLGDFVYLVAINVIIFERTHSAVAVAGLWIIGPIASLCTLFWSGMFIDRLNKRTILITMDIIRALIIAFIPLLSSITLTYIFLFTVSIASSIFGPTSTTYITKHIPKEQRKQFNAYQGIVTSGAFIVGPAFAGLLLINNTPSVAIYINAVSFLLSAIVFLFLPSDLVSEEAKKTKFSIKLLKEDWVQVGGFVKKPTSIMSIYILFQLMMVFAFSLDTQEVVFTQKVVGLTQSDFGFLVSITGLGYVSSSFLISIFVKKLSTKILMGVGSVVFSIGYCIYAFSNSFFSISVGFILLGFFSAASNTGFATFFQQSFPTEMMGRISSIFGLFQSILKICMVLAIGYFGQILSLRITIISGTLIIFCLSVVLLVIVMKPVNEKYLREQLEA